MWNLKHWQVASGIQLLDTMLIHVVPLYLFIPDWILRAYDDEAQLLATDCQTQKSLAQGWRNLLHRHPRKVEQLQQEDERKHKISGLAAAVQHTISLLKVSDMETEAPPSPGTNYGKIFKS